MDGEFSARRSTGGRASVGNSGGSPKPSWMTGDQVPSSKLSRAIRRASKVSISSRRVFWMTSARSSVEGSVLASSFRANSNSLVWASRVLRSASSLRRPSNSSNRLRATPGTMATAARAVTAPVLGVSWVAHSRSMLASDMSGPTIRPTETVIRVRTAAVRPRGRPHPKPTTAMATYSGPIMGLPKPS